MDGDTTAFYAPGSWSFPDDLPRETKDSNLRQRHTANDLQSGDGDSPPASAETEQNDSSSAQQGQQRWKPRTCRICLETVHPTFPTLSENLPSVLQGRPSPVYVSEDCGRLLRPCKCRGSQRYVHEGCLQEWRFADPTNKRNYWECPTCRFQYRLTRMTWARWISSGAMQLGLTLLIFWFAIFLLGFIADPIIDTYLDPVGIIAGGETLDVDPRYTRGVRFMETPLEETYDEGSWAEHFIKGFGALGVLGFVKMFFTMNPFIRLTTRNSFGFGVGRGGGRPAMTGRDRVADVGWYVLLLGAVTFLYTVWKGVRVFSKRVLQKASEHVLDVPLASGEREDDDD